MQGTVTPISTVTNTRGAAIKVGTDPIGISITPDGKTAYVLNSTPDNTLIPISTTLGTVGPAIKVGRFPYSMAITPDSKTVYIADHGDSVTGSGSGVIPVSTATNDAGPAIKTPNGSNSLAISPDGTTLYVSGGYGTSSHGGTVTPIQIATGKPAAPISIKGALFVII